MCIVSFIPVEERIFITSNRDEKHTRKKAAFPKTVSYDHCKILFPCDGEAGGSWIGICDNGNAAVLLNGAFEPHVKLPKYRKSRGLIFLELMNSDYPLKTFLLLSLDGIEPFTLILWQQRRLYELKWDSSGIKHATMIPCYAPRIWFSVTLYDKKVRQEKECLFKDWTSNCPLPSLSNITGWHQLIVKRDGINSFFRDSDNYGTKSITVMELSKEKGKMIHNDLIVGSTNEAESCFKPVIT